MPTIAERLLKNPRVYLGEADLPPAPAPGVDDVPGPDTGAAVPDPIAPAGAAPDPEGMFEPIKKLAKESRPLVQHIVNLKKAYLEDPHLGSKEAETSMAAIMHHLWRKDEKAAYYFGRIVFEPNIDNFIALFDDIGNTPLGPYLGIHDVKDIPGTEDGGAQNVLGAPGDDPNKPGAPLPPAPGGPPSPKAPAGPEAPKLPRL